MFFWPLDYDEKAEDAVDYEDIDEQYEGPEIQALSEEDYLLPKKDYFATGVSVATLEQKTSVFDDENYDEEDDEAEFEKEHELVDTDAEVQTIPSLGWFTIWSMVHLYQFGKPWLCQETNGVILHVTVSDRDLHQVSSWSSMWYIYVQ